MNDILIDAIEALRRRDPQHPLLKALPGAAYIEVPLSIAELAYTLASEEWCAAYPDGLIEFPADARPMKTSIVLAVEWGAQTENWVIQQEQEAVVCRFIPGPGPLHGCVLPVVSFQPGSSWLEDYLPPDDEIDISAVALWISMLLSLINTPRLVERSKISPSRALRRRMERTFGSVPITISRVNWTLGRAIKAKVASGDIAHGVALNWRRAHWAAAKVGEPKAEWVKDRLTGLWAWRRWVVDCWVGHPDFGIKLNMYRPKLEGDTDGPGSLTPAAATLPAKMALLDTRARSALVEAGFA